MENVLKFFVRNNEYCVFLSKHTLNYYFDYLKKNRFETNRIVIDQLFYTGNKKNRFIQFDIDDGLVIIESAKNIVLSEKMINDLNSYFYYEYNELCRKYLSPYDYESISSKKSKKKDYSTFLKGINIVE